MTRLPIIPIVLSGGTGSQLWPLSRPSRPKQYLRFDSALSLVQQTVMRCRGADFDLRPIVVAADAQRFMVAEELRETGVAAEILLEPEGRDSCAAVAAGCLAALERGDDALVLALPSDHHIADHEAFARDIAAAIELAAAGRLVLFAVKPTMPSVAYGYIKPGRPAAGGFGWQVAAFVEKPDEQSATRLLDEGAKWNSGMILCRPRVFLDELERTEPAILAAVSKAHAARKGDLDFTRLDGPSFSAAPAKSVDVAVLEKAKNVVAVPFSAAWSDIGNWDHLWRIGAHDADGNAADGRAEFMGASDNLVHSPYHLTALVGVEGLAVVATRDAVLVTAREHAGKVSALVRQIAAAGHSEASEALRMFRPWGNYERLDIGTRYQVKRIVVSPGGVLSLQKHRHRSEHWVVVEGFAEVTVDEKVSVLGPNESVYVPLGSVHRLANRGSEPVVLIEVQTGSYLGEDDIIRLEDNYNRTH